MQGPAVGIEHELAHGEYAAAYAFGPEKAVRLFRAQHLTAGAAEELGQSFVTVAGLFGHEVENGTGDVVFAESRLKSGERSKSMAESLTMRCRRLSMVRMFRAL